MNKEYSGFTTDNDLARKLTNQKRKRRKNKNSILFEEYKQDGPAQYLMQFNEWLKLRKQKKPYYDNIIDFLEKKYRKKNNDTIGK